MDACEIGDDDRLGRVQSLVRAFGLLDALAKHDDGLTLTEVARIVSLPRSTAHRLLTTMDTMRYVEYDASASRWMIGIQAFTLGSAFVQARDIGRLGRPIMRSLMIEAGEIVNIAVADAAEVRYVAQVKPSSPRRCSTEAGTRLPMHTTASGKALLAHWSPDAVDGFLTQHRLNRRTSASIVDKFELMRRLEDIRVRGYAIDDQENATGIRCVAAPVFDRNKVVRASLSISGSVSRLSSERLNALGGVLAGAARRLEADIGAVLAA